MAHVTVMKLSSYIYQMKAYSFSFEVMQAFFKTMKNVQVMML